MAPFGAGVGISAPLRLRLRYAPIPTILRTPLAGALTFRLKRRQPQVYPLLPSVAEALAHYIDTVRPRTSHQQVFIGLHVRRDKPAECCECKSHTLKG
jgi:hypothetical protein